MHLTEQSARLTLDRRDRPAITPAQIEAGERIFAEWKSENWGAIHEDGALGDVPALLTKLAAVFS
jgi:hypothetical protein